MKRKRYSVEQITAALQQHEAGLSVEAITRKLRCGRADILSLEEAIWWPAAG